MFTGLLLKLIYILFKFSFLFLLSLFSLSHSSSISTLNNLSSSNQFEFMSNSSYRNFILRQYFIDLLNISHASLVRSMIYDYQLNSRSIENNKNRRRKRLNDDSLSYSPIFTLQSSNCLIINNQVQSTFIWSQTINSLNSIELIYHIDSNEIKKLTILPLHIKFKHIQTLIELLTIDIYLEFDFNRDFFSINLYQYIIQINQQQLIIETYLQDETCQTSHTYIIISSSKSNPKFSFDYHHHHQLKQTQIDSSLSMCKLKTIQIKFEDLGLAYLIIRPREYLFTYCDGTCSFQQQSSMHALFQSIVNRKNSFIPQPTCAPSSFANDNFLLRQMDGTMEIYPIKDVIVKQCACL